MATDQPRTFQALKPPYQIWHFEYPGEYGPDPGYTVDAGFAHLCEHVYKWPVKWTKELGENLEKLREARRNAVLKFSPELREDPDIPDFREVRSWWVDPRRPKEPCDKEGDKDTSTVTIGSEFTDVNEYREHADYASCTTRIWSEQKTS
jgi:hypothetical protein